MKRGRNGRMGEGRSELRQPCQRKEEQERTKERNKKKEGTKEL